MKDAQGNEITDEESQGGDEGKSQGTDNSLGFPKNTPLADMTTDEQLAYWKHQARKHETAVKGMTDYDDLKAKAQRLADLEAANATDAEKAIAAAKAEAAKEERMRLAPSLVRTAFRAEAKGILEPEQVAELLEDLDLSKYLTAEGDVDEAKVAKKVGAFAPKKTEKTGNPGGTGQGRTGTQKMSAREAGIAEAARRGFIKT